MPADARPAAAGPAPSRSVSGGEPLEETESTHVFGPGTVKKERGRTAPSPGAADPVLGMVVAYTSQAEPLPDGNDPRHGVLYPLRKGEVLFVGRPPAPTEVVRSDGTRVRPAACHLFPSTREYAHISRRHLTVEMDPAEGILLTDFSSNGIYLLPQKSYHRRDPETPSRTHRLESGATVILGIDLTGTTPEDARAERFRIQVFRPAASGREGSRP